MNPFIVWLAFFMLYGLIPNAFSEPSGPAIERRPITPIDIDDENIELGLHAGIVSIEDFSVDTLWIARLAYHITEDIFIEASYGQADAGQTSFENITGINLLSTSDRTYRFYDMNVGWNLLPGESFIMNRWALTSSFYLIAGVGQTEFADTHAFTLSLGAGYRVLVTDAIAWHLDFRDYLFDSDLLGDEKTTHNLAFSSGVAVFF